MKKLLDQMIKFGLVGAVCFVIDYVIGLTIMNLIMVILSADYFDVASVAGSAVGFSISVVANYFLSFKFVFVHRDNLSRNFEFITFVILSIIGLLLNSFLIWAVVGPVYGGSVALQENVGYNLMYTGAKVFAAAVVMVYNFTTRKIFLDKKEPEVNS